MDLNRMYVSQLLARQDEPRHSQRLILLREGAQCR